MIQANAVSTAQPGLFATLKSLLFSGEPIRPVRRAPNDAERRFLLDLRERAWALMDTHEIHSDAELVTVMVTGLIEPLQDLTRRVAASWSEPHLGRLTALLADVNCGVSSFDEKLIDRDDLIDGAHGLDELANDLGVLARGLV